MKKFRSPGEVQRFLSAFSGISPHFRPAAWVGGGLALLCDLCRRPVHESRGLGRLELLGSKPGATRLRFAALLKFFEIDGRFPEYAADLFLCGVLRC